MKDFRELNVWRKAHRLALEVYKATAGFPREELYGLTGQMRRAGMSVPTNITEGCGRNTDGEFGRFLGIAMGSASELEYLLLLSRDLKLLEKRRFETLNGSTTEVKRMLAALLKKLKADR